MATRPAGKAGSWYEASPAVLEEQLKDFMSSVPESIGGKPLPIAGARIVIAPHAGYSYSGPCAGWAYKTLDLANAKRVFVLGPSHTYAFRGCAVTKFSEYETPFGDLKVDTETVKQVKAAAKMATIPTDNDEDEHSLEMHMPYLYLRCQETFDSPDKFPSIVPILVGTTYLSDEKTVGQALLPYLKDPQNAFVISSDFCHWGRRFGYTAYSATSDASNLASLRSSDPEPSSPPIHETIKLVDEAAMDAVKSGSHDAFYHNLEETGNTVCGRHPIGVMMAAMELLRKEPGFEDKGRFDVINYDRSSLVRRKNDSSVSYVSAYAVA